jgi:serine/threonine-protein kinase
MAVLGACASAPPWSNGLGLRAQAPAQPPAAKGHSQDAEANALFDRAQDLLSHSDPRTGGTFANAREAIKLYQQAIDRDPHFALAYVQIARAWMAQGYSNPEAPPSTEIEAHSRSALKRALEINPNLTEAHQLQAQVHYLSDYNWAAAEREYRWAIEHDSNNASSHSGLAAFLATMGRFDEALAEAAIADTIRRSPADAFNRARIYYSMRNYDAAVENCRQALSTQENQAFRFFLGLMLIAQGHPQDGVTELERAASQGDNAGASLGLAYGYATIGRRGDALRVIERVRATHTEDQVVSYRLAAAYLALGDRDGAIRELQRDRDGHGNWIVQLKVDPVMDPLRNDPRFQQLMRTMKFPE